MHVASSVRILFLRISPLAGFLLDKFLLQEIFWGIVTPPPVISNGPSLNRLFLSPKGQFSPTGQSLSHLSTI